MHYPEYELYIYSIIIVSRNDPVSLDSNLQCNPFDQYQCSFGSSDRIISTWRSKYCSKFLYKCTIRFETRGGGKNRWGEKNEEKIEALTNSRPILLCLSGSPQVFRRFFPSPYICIIDNADSENIWQILLRITNLNFIFLISLNSNFLLFKGKVILPDKNIICNIKWDEGRDCEKWKIHGLIAVKNYYHFIAIFLNSTIFLIFQILFSFSREKVVA